MVEASFAEASSYEDTFEVLDTTSQVEADAVAVAMAAVAEQEEETGLLRPEVPREPRSPGDHSGACRPAERT